MAAAPVRARAQEPTKPETKQTQGETQVEPKTAPGAQTGTGTVAEPAPKAGAATGAEPAVEAAAPGEEEEIIDVPATASGEQEPGAAPSGTTTKAPAPTHVEEVYVTGSRIKRKDLITSGPVSVVGRQQMDATGLRSTGDILQKLPEQSNATNTNYNNGGDGSTRVALRGLGAERTLVLVNGRRFVGGGVGADAAVDLNTIPSEIIERVEILKDGASAVYGSDAVAGVVNIITKRRFNGIEASTYFGGTKEGAIGYNLGVTAGEGAEKGGFLLSFNYYRQNALMTSKRNFAKADLDYNWTSREESNKGSSAVPEGYIRESAKGNSAWNRVLARGDASSAFFNDPRDGWRAFQDTGNRDSNTGDYYNFQPENYLVMPSQRLSLWASGDYEVGTLGKAYFEGTYTSRRSDQLLAPEPLSTGQEGIVLSAASAYNPFGVDFTDVRRRLVEAGNRKYNQDLDTYRASGGIEGKLPGKLGPFSNWNWDLNFTYGRTSGISLNQGRLVLSRLQAALGPSYIDENGNGVCGTRDAPIAECVPLDLFGGAGSITPEMLKRLTYTGTARGFTEQRMASLVTDGELFKLWNRPVGLAVGYQLRRESGAYTPDPLTASGDTTGNKEEGVAGGYTENAGFAELQVPVLADLPLVKVLEASGAIRAFNFSSFGTGATWKFGGRWQMIDQIALRSTYSSAFRAPSISELYSGNADNFAAVSDPCDVSSGARNDVADANCKADGVPDGLKANTSQQPAVVGGNPKLRPESARILTAGVVITPKGNKYTEGLSLTADYFRIKIRNAISSIGADVILNNCYNFENRTYCDLIQRSQTGMITRIDDRTTNIGGSDTSGVDFGIVYALPTVVGRFNLNMNGVWLDAYKSILADRTVNGKGTYDLQTVTPALRFNTGASWSLRDLELGTSLHFVGPLRECKDNDCVKNAQFSRGVSSNVTADVYGSYSFSNPTGMTSVMAGVNNVLNQDPSKIYAGFLANSDASAYDYLGRFFYVALRHQL